MDIAGKWKIVEAELGGRKLPASEFEKIVLELDETSYQLTEGKVIAAGILNLIPGSNPHSDPNAMIISVLFGPNEGTKFHCIYRFEGEDLLMCYNLGGDSLPGSFETFDNTLLYLVRYRRIGDA